MATNKELTEKNKKMRDLLKLAESKIKELTNKVEVDKVDHNKPAVGGFYDKEKREWNIVKLKYNSETGTGEVYETTSVGRDYAMLEYRIKEFVATQILLPTQRDE